MKRPRLSSHTVASLPNATHILYQYIQIIFLQVKDIPYTLRRFLFLETPKEAIQVNESKRATPPDSIDMDGRINHLPQLSRVYSCDGFREGCD